MKEAPTVLKLEEIEEIDQKHLPQLIRSSKEIFKYLLYGGMIIGLTTGVVLTRLMDCFSLIFYSSQPVSETYLSFMGILLSTIMVISVLMIILIAKKIIREIWQFQKSLNAVTTPYGIHPLFDQEKKV
jgi:flagellar biosynthesis protein FlhB